MIPYREMMMMMLNCIGYIYFDFNFWYVIYIRLINLQTTLIAEYIIS